MEYVWDYPRPPRLASEPRRLSVQASGRLIAETMSGYRVLETSAPPTYYFPPDDVDLGVLAKNPAQSFCEFKGDASYWDITVADETRQAAAWSYAVPNPDYAALRDYLAFYPGRLDACTVGQYTVRAQPGDFYGGWITPDLAGPFKGAVGTVNW